MAIVFHKSHCFKRDVWDFSNVDIVNFNCKLLQTDWQARRGGGGGRGATCPGPQTSRGPQLEKYPKIEQGPIKIGASTRH